MNKYKIAKNVEIDNCTNVIKTEQYSKVGPVLGVIGGPLFGAVAATVDMINEVATIDITEITSVEELDKFTCVDGEWHKDIVYVEHPVIKNRLIDAKRYKDYILKELMSEMIYFITDNISVKKIILGMKCKEKADAHATIPIENVVVDTSVKGALDKNYFCILEDVDSKCDIDREYYWLKYYPDIIAAVKKDAGKLDMVQTVKMDLDVSLGIGKTVKGAFNAEKEYEFYVHYEKM